MSLTWKQRLEKAKKRGKFSKGDYTKVISFTSCAVGEKLKLTRKSVSWDLIVDSQLYYLGMEFFRAVASDRVDQALKLYKIIRKQKVGV